VIMMDLRGMRIANFLSMFLRHAVVCTRGARRALRAS
jgi:hypothetical protein